MFTSTQARRLLSGSPRRILLPVVLTLIGAVSTHARSVVISVTDRPVLSTSINNSAVLSTAWTSSGAYTDVSISVLLNSAIVGQTPKGIAYLTTSIGPDVTAANEIARSQFTVPSILPICSDASCGAMVPVFSGLTLGAGTYYLTLGPDPLSTGVVGWFPALNPTVTLGADIRQGGSYFGSQSAYPPASSFQTSFFGPSMIFEVNGTSIPEPTTTTLLGAGLAAAVVAAKRQSTVKTARPVPSRGGRQV